MLLRNTSTLFSGQQTVDSQRFSGQELWAPSRIAATRQLTISRARPHLTHFGMILLSVSLLSSLPLCVIIGASSPGRHTTQNKPATRVIIIVLLLQRKHRTNKWGVGGQQQQNTKLPSPTTQNAWIVDPLSVNVVIYRCASSTSSGYR